MVEQQLLPLRLRECAGFDSFVPGSNQWLIELLQELAQGGQQQLFIHAGKGCGKTHLLEACVRRAADLDRQPMLLVASELLSLGPVVLDGLAVSGLLAIDDVDQLLGDPAWEEALFHLYNRCRQLQGSLLFSSSCPLSGLDCGLADLRSRLGAGPVCELASLHEEGLSQMLMERAKARGLTLEQGVVEFLLRRVARNPGQLVDMLDRLEKAAFQQKRLITIPLVKQELGL